MRIFNSTNKDNFMVVMNLYEYKYLRQFDIMKLPEYKNIDINSDYVWALNPERIYVDGKTLRNNLRLLYISHKMQDKFMDDKLMNELARILDASK